MTPEQAAAFINTQTICAQAELMAMFAKNKEREADRYALAYDEDAFRSVPENFGITYNQVVEFFKTINEANQR